MVYFTIACFGSGCDGLLLFVLFISFNYFPPHHSLPLYLFYSQKYPFVTWIDSKYVQIIQNSKSSIQKIPIKQTPHEEAHNPKNHNSFDMFMVRYLDRPAWKACSSDAYHGLPMRPLGPARQHGPRPVRRHVRDVPPDRARIDQHAEVDGLGSWEV